MSYRGKTYRIPFSSIGYNANPNFDSVPANSLVSPSKNLNLHEGGVAPRGGTASAYSSSSNFTGIFDYRTVLSGTTPQIISLQADGTISKNVASLLDVGFTASSFADFVVYNNRLYITIFRDGAADLPQEYDGAGTLRIRGIGSPNACTAALAGTGAGNVDNGTHYYRVQFYNGSGSTSGGYISSVTVADKTTNGQVNLTGIPVGPAGTTGRVIYRTAAGTWTDFKSLATIADNVTTTYTDNTADASLGDTLTRDLSTFQNVPADWRAVGKYPKQMVKHGYGNSERLWCFNVPSLPHWIYITPNNDGSSSPDFSDATILTMYIETGDSFGLCGGGVVYQDRLIAFGRRKAYIIDDSDANTALWGYVEAGWEGGAASHRLVVKTPNDIICMMDDGEIYSVTAVQSYGDYKLASISRPHFMHVWIKANVDLSKINQFHAIFDPKLRAVRFWVVRTGQTECDTILTYYVDLGKWGPPEDNLTNPSGCKAACSAIVKESTGEYNIWSGGYAVSGTSRIWKLNQSAKNDNSLAFSSLARTPHLSFESEDDTGPSRQLKSFQSGRIVAVPKGSYSVTVKSVVDGDDERSDSISLASGTNIVDEPFDIGMTGKRYALEISNTTLNVDYLIAGADIQFKPLGEQDNLG